MRTYKKVHLHIYGENLNAEFIEDNPPRFISTYMEKIF